MPSKQRGMPQAKTLSRQVIELAVAFAKGIQSEALLPLLDELAAATRRAVQRFEQAVPDNPEIDAASAQALRAAFAAHLHQMEQMQRAVERSDVNAVSGLAIEMESTASAIRDAQTAHQRRLLSEGPTPWLYLNRVLVHLDYFLHGGRETRHTLTLLATAPSFVRQLLESAVCSQGTDADRRVAESAATDIRNACARLEEVLQHPGVERVGALRRVRALLMDAAERLKLLLEAHVERDFAQGPTQILPVNMVLLAAAKRSRGDCDEREFIKILQRCRDGLPTLQGRSTDPMIAHAIAVVQAELDYILTECAAMNADNVDDFTADLVSAANDLAAYLSISERPEWAEDETLVNVLSGGEAPTPVTPAMPRMLASLLRVGEAYVNGSGTQARLVARIDRLDATLNRYAGRAESDNTSPAMQGMRKAVELLREASESLRSLVRTRDRRALTAAEWLMRQASESLIPV